MDHNIVFYSQHGKKLAEQYDSVAFEAIHKDWLDHVPTKGIVLDVGAGSGRDARFLASQGLSVVAVEPADGIRDVAQQYSAGHHQGSIHWISDRLPELNKVFELQTKFDLILLSAVWMHIPKSLRNRCMRRLSALLKPKGKLIISLRHGDCQDERTMYSVSATELANLASQYGLSYRLLVDAQQSDELGRCDVNWQTVLLTLPDDGTGAFSLLRNIVVNDRKASTYKVALLRTLLRIAQGHAGAVIEQEDECVTLPMGLVALYWMKLYKPLIDQYDMQQSSSIKGLGFIKDKGWKALSSYNSGDFYIGATYQMADIALELYQTLKDICVTIKTMPVKYIRLPNTDKAVFEVELHKTQRPKHSLVLNFSFLSSLGKFRVPRAIWDSLTRFSVWIEPALVNEWSMLMASYSMNKEKSFSQLDYWQALHWDDPERSTTRVRKRVDALLNTESVCCCWSGSAIRRSSYAIDHAFPFARWPNNDLWNLLPTKAAINSQKSDKLVTTKKLVDAREDIVSWWQQGWVTDKIEFFTQANFALPNLSPNNDSFDDVFAAFSLQRSRIKDFQQLEDW